jgi:hypothetical protein
MYSIDQRRDMPFLTAIAMDGMNAPTALRRRSVKANAQVSMPALHCLAAPNLLDANFTAAHAYNMKNGMPNLPAEPKQVIEHIRRFEFGIGASLKGDGEVVVENMRRRYQNLLATIAEDLNS